MMETGVGRLVLYRNRLLMIAVSVNADQLSLVLDALPLTGQPVILVKFAPGAGIDGTDVLLDVSDLS